MDTKTYLCQISRLDRVIDNKMTEIKQLRTLFYGVSAIKNEEKTSSMQSVDKIGSAYCKIERMEEELDKLIDEYVDKKNEIIAQIDSMEDEMHYEILFARYIEKKTFERIATDIHYSFRNTTRLHGKALQEFEKKYGHLYLGNVS